MVPYRGEERVLPSCMLGKRDAPSYWGVLEVECTGCLSLGSERGWGSTVKGEPSVKGFQSGTPGWMRGQAFVRVLGGDWLSPLPLLLHTAPTWGRGQRTESIWISSSCCLLLLTGEAQPSF